MTASTTLPTGGVLHVRRHRKRQRQGIRHVVLNEIPAEWLSGQGIGSATP